jgi:hypothetical protein
LLFGASQVRITLSAMTDVCGGFGIAGINAQTS